MRSGKFERQNKGGSNQGRYSLKHTNSRGQLLTRVGGLWHKTRKGTKETEHKHQNQSRLSKRSTADDRRAERGFTQAGSATQETRPAVNEEHGRRKGGGKRLHKSLTTKHGKKSRLSNEEHGSRKEGRERLHQSLGTNTTHTYTHTHTRARAGRQRGAQLRRGGHDQPRQRGALTPNQGAQETTAREERTPCPKCHKRS